MLFLTAETAECLSLRISDIIEYSPTREAFIQSIGAHNVATLQEMSELHLYDFGIFIELLPDEEEKQLLENNIQVAISKGLIDLDDAIDIREIKNIKLANQLLKMKRRKKMERDQAMSQQNLQAQAQAQQQAAQEAARIDIEKNQAKLEGESNLEQTKNQLKIKYLRQEAIVKKELMMLEYELNSRIKTEEKDISNQMELMKEDRKDNRTHMEASYKSKLQKQKEGDSLNNFESSGNDILTGGVDIDKFTPDI
jgi:hypothetical protein